MCTCECMCVSEHSKMNPASVLECVCAHVHARVYLSTDGKVRFNYPTVVSKRKLQRNIETCWQTAQNTYRLTRQVEACCRTLNNGLKTSLLLPVSEAFTGSHIISLSMHKTPGNHHSKTRPCSDGGELRKCSFNGKAPL